MAELHRVLTTITGISGSPYFNHTYFDLGSLTDPSSAVAVMNEFWDALAPPMVTPVSGTISGDVPVIESTTGAIVRIDSTAGASFAGGSADESLPFATQGLLRTRTGTFTAGRELRGRIFLPGFNEGSSLSGVPTASLITAADNAGLSLVNGGAVVYSPTHRVFVPITSASMWSQWAVLRSRRD